MVRNAAQGKEDVQSRLSLQKFKRGLCVELNGDFNRSWAGTVQNLDPQTAPPTGLLERR